MARSFDHESKITVAREIDSGCHVRSVAGFHGMRAGCGRPGIEPAADLRAAWLVADLEGIGDILERVEAG